jgi:hypothetical protein
MPRSELRAASHGDGARRWSEGGRRENGRGGGGPAHDGEMRRAIGMLGLVAACEPGPVELAASDNASCETAIELEPDTVYAIDGDLAAHGDIHTPDCGDPGPARVRDAVFWFALDEPRLLLLGAHSTTTYLALEIGACGDGAAVACGWYSSGGFLGDGSYASIQRRLDPGEYTLFVEGTETAEEYRLDLELRAPHDAPDGTTVALPVDYVSGEGSRVYAVDVPPYHVLKLWGGGAGTYVVRDANGEHSRGELWPGSGELRLDGGRYEIAVDAPGAFDFALIDYSAD